MWKPQPSRLESRNRVSGEPGAVHFEPRDYLGHILVEADYPLEESAGLSFEDFATDETLRRAFVRSLEVIGEAAKQVPEDSERPIHLSNGVPWPACAIG